MGWGGRGKGRNGEGIWEEGGRGGRGRRLGEEMDTEKGKGKDGDRGRKIKGGERKEIKKR